MQQDPPTFSPKRWGWFGLSPLIVFLSVYLLTSICAGDFYKMPITVAFTVASIYAVAITRGIKLEERIRQYSRGASDPNILLMIWIFVLAGAFATGAKSMGAIDATVNLILTPPLLAPPPRTLHRGVLHLPLHRHECRHGHRPRTHRPRAR